MDVDIYDSMAKGVQGAQCVVAFMTQRYQESENCMLELKFAKQSKVPIIPVVLQGDGWSADDWLGLITAGALWTPLCDEQTFESGADSLHEQWPKPWPKLATPAASRSRTFGSRSRTCDVRLPRLSRPVRRRKTTRMP
jgi:hypothetical protein